MRSTNLLSDVRKAFKESLEGTMYGEESDNLFWLLTEEYTSHKKTSLLSEYEPRLSESVIKMLEQAADLLRKGYPVQHITGKAHFFGLDLNVNNSVLIPRPETEELVEWIIRENRDSKGLSILDIGTGSGCIAIALAKHLPGSEVRGLDISQAALEIAGINALQNKVDVELFRADIFDEDLYRSPDRYDIIISNPPYVRESEKSRMRKNVTDFEPPGALFVPDSEPFRYYRAILNLSQIQLEWGGSLYVEINEHLSAEFESWLKDLGYREYEFRKDFNGKVRMVKIRI